MSRILRYLRIGWSGFFGLLAVSLCVFWVRSYSWADELSSTTGQFQIALVNGSFYTDNAAVDYVVNGNPFEGFAGYKWANYQLMTYRIIKPVFIPQTSRLALPMWAAIVGALICAAAPWFRWRFGLRTLLIATTLVAVGVGTIVWLSK